MHGPCSGRFAKGDVSAPNVGKPASIHNKTLECCMNWLKGEDMSRRKPFPEVKARLPYVGADIHDCSRRKVA